MKSRLEETRDWAHGTARSVQWSIELMTNSDASLRVPAAPT